MGQQQQQQQQQRKPVEEIRISRPTCIWITVVFAAKLFDRSFLQNHWSEKTNISVQKNMIEQTASINSGDLLKMTDLEDLNGAFYDIDAQDLLDVWEAMDSGVRL